MESDADGPLAAFDRAVVVAVADDHGVDADDLRALLTRHQRSIADFPGIDDLYYEWRRLHPSDPLVVRTPVAYVLAVHEGIWQEFADALELTDAERDQLRATHDRQARRFAETEDATTDLLDAAGTTGVVLARFA